MNIRTIKTRKVTPECCTIFELLDESITTLSEGSVVAVTSKVVALCEGGVVPLEGTDKDELIAEHASHFLPRSLSRYNVSFAIAEGRLAPGAGIDESNAGGFYILWPQDSQKSANDIRAHLRQKFGLKNLGVIITDSTTRPMQWGTTGVALAHSGFKALHNYIGEPDLFGREFVFANNSIMQGLAAATVLPMGEGAEQTPLAIAEDLPFVEFQDADPTVEELRALEIAPEDDLYAPFFNNAPWQQGRGQ
jgi:F420-0:gamma-glutamyl ligase